jgi:DNA-binding CsgD family transcriptional regulator
VLEQQLSEDARARRSTVLSPREVEVIEIAALGLTNAQVADRLSVSVHAVKFHLASIYRKLGVTNRTEAAFVYLRGDERGRSSVDRAGIV